MAKAASKATTKATSPNKHAGGRPTKLTQELVDKAAGYITETQFGGALAGDLPTDVGLAIYLGISRSTLYEWAGKESQLAKEFSDTLEKVNDYQRYKLVNAGLQNKFNPTITKMLLNVNHGMVEKQQIDQNVKGDVTFVNDVPRGKK